MKKSIICIFVLVALISGKSEKEHYKLDEGIATFEFTYPDALDASKEFMAQQEKTMTLYFKNGWSRAEVVPDNDNGIADIIEPKTRNEVQMISGHGNKLAVKMTRREREENLESGLGKCEVKLTNETKVIEGYNCKKALVIISDSLQKKPPIEIWFTNEINAGSPRNSFKGVDGFIMESSWTVYYFLHGFANGAVPFRINMKCTKVEKAKVSDSLFKIPDGYQVKTWAKENNYLKVEHR